MTPPTFTEELPSWRANIFGPCGRNVASPVRKPTHPQVLNREGKSPTHIKAVWVRMYNFRLSNNDG